MVHPSEPLMLLTSSRNATASVLFALTIATASALSAQSTEPFAPAVSPAIALEDTPAASRDMAWYTAEVPVSSQEGREHDAALGRALAQVLVRMTGQLSAPSDPVLQRALRSAGTLSTGTEYRDAEEIAGGVAVRRQMLAASFDPDAVDALIEAAGLPLWVGERPKPMLWLAIDDGSGPRLVSAAQITVVKPLAQRGLERGLRLLLPAGSAVEQPAADSIWRLDPAQMAVLSSRYGARVQLLGKVSRAADGGWQADWLLAEGDAALKRWSFSDVSPQRVIASGADQAADVLAARQARVLASGAPETLVAEITGVDSEARWLALASYLQTLPVLRTYEVLEARPDTVRLRLDLAVDRARFEALLAGGRQLVIDESPAATPVYRLSR
jgi:hypothetical protein